MDTRSTHWRNAHLTNIASLFPRITNVKGETHCAAPFSVDYSIFRLCKQSVTLILLLAATEVVPRQYWIANRPPFGWRY